MAHLKNVNNEELRLNLTVVCDSWLSQGCQYVGKRAALNILAVAVERDTKRIDEPYVCSTCGLLALALFVRGNDSLLLFNPTMQVLNVTTSTRTLNGRPLIDTATRACLG